MMKLIFAVLYVSFNDGPYTFFSLCVFLSVFVCWAMLPDLGTRSSATAEIVCNGDVGGHGLSLYSNLSSTYNLCRLNSSISIKFTCALFGFIIISV